MGTLKHYVPAGTLSRCLRMRGCQRPDEPGHPDSPVGCPWMGSQVEVELLAHGAQVRSIQISHFHSAVFSREFCA